MKRQIVKYKGKAYIFDPAWQRRPFSCGHLRSIYCGLKCQKTVPLRIVKLAGEVGDGRGAWSARNYSWCPTCRRVDWLYEGRRREISLHRIPHPLDEKFIKAKGWTKHLNENGCIEVCAQCWQLIPSVQRRPFIKAANEAASALSEAEVLLEKLTEQMTEDPTTTILFQCENCDELFSEDALVQQRQCSKDACGEPYFDGSEGNNCPDCNNPFTRNISEEACPDCVTDGEADTTKIDVPAKLAELTAALPALREAADTLAAQQAAWDKEHGFAEHKPAG